MISFSRNTREFFVLKIISKFDKVNYELSKIFENKEGLQVDESDFLKINSIEEIKSFVEEKPVFVCFLGENILYYNNDSLIKSFNQSFYSTSYKNNDKQTTYAFIRKENVDKTIENLLEENIFIFDIYIGVLTFLLLQKERYNLSDTVLLDSSKMTFKNHDFHDIEKISLNEKKDINLHNENLLNVSLVLNHLFPNDKILNTYSNSFFKKNKEEIKNKKDFEKIGRIGVVSLFSILFLGYILGFVFKKQNIKLNNQYVSNTAKASILTSKKTELAKKKEMLKLSGFSNTSSITYITNQIVKTLPENISLSELDIYPVEEKKKDKKIIINNKLILISGISENAMRFNNWIPVLRKELDALTVEIIKYNKKGKLVNFEIQIVLNG